MLDHACAQMKAWRKTGISLPILAVNLSLKQLQSGGGLVEFVTRTLTKWGLAPGDLELDVSEAMLVYLTLHGNIVLEQLQQLGVKIAIDDFGTQYSSLGYLKTYRVSRVKIPRSLVDACTRDPEALAMVRAIIGIGRDFGIGVVAKGVETEAQWELLTCPPSPTGAQGFYYSAAVASAEATELLRHGVVGSRFIDVSARVAAQ